MIQFNIIKYFCAVYLNKKHSYPNNKAMAKAIFFLVQKSNIISLHLTAIFQKYLCQYDACM